jgi:hypothetical protein
MSFELPLLAIVQVGTFWGPLFVAALGLFSGIVSMAIYHRYSPQKKIRELKHHLDGLQRELATYDGDFAGAMTLSKQNVRLSFRRLGLALMPAVASALPVLAPIPLVGESYITYFSVVAVSALAVKYFWKVV